MIPAAGIQDQELAVSAEGPGINHPAVARSRDLGAGPGGDRQALFGAAEAVGGAEFPDSHAVDRQRQQALGGREGDRRGEPAGVACSAARSGRPSGGLRSSLARPPPRAVRAPNSRPCSSLAIRSLRLAAWRASCGGALALARRAPSRPPPAASGAPRSAATGAGGRPPAPARSRAELVALARRSRLRSRTRSARSAASASASCAHLRQHRAEHHGRCAPTAAHPRPHHHRGRRPAADALQGGQHLGDHVRGAPPATCAAPPRCSSSGLRRSCGLGDRGPRRCARARRCRSAAG